jgi:hypothetical protein
MRRTKYTLEERAAAITACEQSGLNRAVWCRQNKIPYNRFMWWLKSQRKEEGQSSAFVQIKTSAPQPVSDPIEIHIREHIRICVPNADTLQAILPSLLAL